MDVGYAPKQPPIVSALTGHLGEETAHAIEQQKIRQILAVRGVALATDAHEDENEDSQRISALDDANGKLVLTGLEAV